MPTKSIEIVDDNISVISSVYDNDFVPENTYNNDGWWKFTQLDSNMTEWCTAAETIILWYWGLILESFRDVEKIVHWTKIDLFKFYKTVKFLNLKNSNPTKPLTFKIFKPVKINQIFQPPKIQFQLISDFFFSINWFHFIFIYT